MGSSPTPTRFHTTQAPHFGDGEFSGHEQADSGFGLYKSRGSLARIKKGKKKMRAMKAEVYNFAQAVQEQAVQVESWCSNTGAMTIL